MYHILYAFFMDPLAARTLNPFTVSASIIYIQHLSKSMVSSVIFGAFDLGSLSNALSSVEDAVDLALL